MSKHASDAEVTDVEYIVLQDVEQPWITKESPHWNDRRHLGKKTLRMAKGLFSSGLSGREIHSDCMNIWMLGVVLCLMRFWCRKRPCKERQYNVVPTSYELLFQYDHKTTYFSKVEVPLLQHVFSLTRKASLRPLQFESAIFGPTSSEATGVERLIQIQI